MSTRIKNPDTILVALDRILPNPWQTRQVRTGDDEHVASLAADIQTRGLLQPPLARLVDAAGVPVPVPVMPNETYCRIRDDDLRAQLAFGHNRVAAYRLLAQQDPEEWGRIPIRLASLDDQAMALAAWSENAARKDLSPLEAAQALQRLITDFGWTQEQIAEQTGLARSTVANKLRLLRLPEKLQKKLHNGDLSERQALSILPAFELPDTVQEQIAQARERNQYFVTKFDEVLAHPDKRSSGDVREVIRSAVMEVTDALSNAPDSHYGRATFPVERAIDGVAAPACLACGNRVQESRCGDHACYQQKQAAFERAELAFASAATGLPVISNVELNKRPWEAKKLFGSDRRKELQQALERRCPNLRIHYERSDPCQWDVRVPDYPHAAYVCVHDADAICTCADAAEVKRQEKERQAEAGKKKEAEKLRERAVKELTAALQAQDLGAWHAVLYALRSNYYGNHGDRDKVAPLNARQTLENIARETLKAAFDWTNLRVDAVTALAAWREKVGWMPAAEPAPAPLIEVVDDESEDKEGPTLLADVAGEAGSEQGGLHPCSLDCLGIESMGTGRYYCDLRNADATLGEPCSDYEPMADAVLAGVDDEEQDL